jgi:hypothetical protein
LWAFAARYFADDGRLTGISAQEIETEVQWWGKPGEMLEALLAPDTRFLELDGDTYVIHDWLEHEGHLSAFKKRAKTAAAARWNKISPQNDHPPNNANGNASSNAPTCIALPTSLSHPERGKKTLAEKIRGRRVP